MKPTDPVNLVCPMCGRSPVTCMVPSERGAYCGCDFCGHMWQQEGLFFNRQSPPAITSRRRRTDWGGSGGRPTEPVRADGTQLASGEQLGVEAVRCSHCGMIDERRDREVRRLTERVAELEAENRLLESSARAFGELAERLNQRIRFDRRGGLDRRRVERSTPDRRAPQSLEG